VLFARTEGIVPAPEPTHALAAAVEEALRCKESGEEKVILTALCGHGHLDLPAYHAYLNNEIVDASIADESLRASIAEALTTLPTIAG
jgi:tryptophan synthase beta chain